MTGRQAVDKGEVARHLQRRIDKLRDDYAAEVAAFPAAEEKFRAVVAKALVKEHQRVAGGGKLNASSGGWRGQKATYNVPLPAGVVVPTKPEKPSGMVKLERQLALLRASTRATVLLDADEYAAVVGK